MAKSASEWENLLNNLGDKPTYTSNYQSTIDSLLNKITNRESFSYDFNADPLYQQYKDSYVKLGNEASMNAAANASALSGGYGNSYATTAAAQANQQYLTQLNNVIPELANAALNKYKMETEDLYNQYAAYGNAEDRAYGQYRDTVSDYYSDRDYYTSGYQDARDFEYQQERDKVSDSQWQQSFDYQKYRDQVSDSQWQQSFDTSNSQWQQTFDYNQNRDNISDQQWKDTFDYQKERDLVSDSQWEKNYALSSASAANSAASLAWQKEKYYNDLALQKEAEEKAAEESRRNAGTATDNDFAKYKDFVTTHGFTEQQSYDYLKRLFNDYKIDEEQLKRLARWAGISLD